MIFTLNLSLRRSQLAKSQVWFLLIRIMYLLSLVYKL